MECYQHVKELRTHRNHDTTGEFGIFYELLMDFNYLECQILYMCLFLVELNVVRLIAFKQ